jgi:hypothetical protein
MQRVTCTCAAALNRVTSDRMPPGSSRRYVGLIGGGGMNRGIASVGKRRSFLFFCFCKSLKPLMLTHDLAVTLVRRAGLSAVGTNQAAANVSTRREAATPGLRSPKPVTRLGTVPFGEYATVGRNHNRLLRRNIVTAVQYRQSCSDGAPNVLDRFLHGVRRLPCDRACSAFRTRSPPAGSLHCHSFVLAARTSSRI